MVSRRSFGIVVGASLLGLGLQARSATYPAKPIRLVVPFPPGGSSDAVVRMVVLRLTERLGQQVVVDNRPGAGGNIGLSLVASARPDGYTIGIGPAGALAANSSLYARMPFDPLGDFNPVSMLATMPFIIVGHPDVPARSLKELITLARSQPGQISIGHGGNGTAMHLTVALFAQTADIQILEVPYKGSGPVVLDVMSGHIDLGVVDAPASLQHIKAGKLIAYAVTGTQRLPALPDVPTVAEAGLTGYDSTGWFGVVAPAGTPAGVVAKLNQEINAVLSEESIKIGMRNLGVEPAGGTPDAFDAYIRDETVKWADVVKRANIKLD